MDREDIIKLAREAGLAYGSDEKPLGSVTRFAALVAAAERNKLAAWMIQFGFATGHGDTMEQLVDALGSEIVDRIECEIDTERSACAKVCDGMDHNGVMIAADCAAAIRARGNSETHR
jgi:hypothetical protein